MPGVAPRVKYPPASIPTFRVSALDLSDPKIFRSVFSATERFHGLRILRQPLGEALFAFLLSTVKSIPQIKELCELTAKKYGEEIVPGIHALPTWERLARVSEKELRALKLGYRAKYVTQTAQLLAEEPDFFSEVEN